MMRSSSSKTSSLLLPLLPIAVVIMGYNLFFHWPTQKALKSAGDKLERLQKQEVEQLELASNRALIKRLQSELDAVTMQSSSEEAQLNSVFNSDAQWTEATDVVNRLVDLFRRHQLVIRRHDPAAPPTTNDFVQLDNLITKYGIENLARGQGTASSAAVPTSARPTRGRRSNNATTNTSRPERWAYEFQLSGRFQDVLDSVRDIVDNQPEVIPVSVELFRAQGSANSPTDERNWVITVTR